jgi:hypothetical protein
VRQFDRGERRDISPPEQPSSTGCIPAADHRGAVSPLPILFEAVQSDCPLPDGAEIVFVLNNEGYMVERALEANPDWEYNDLAPWNYHALPAALGCRGWFRAKVTTRGELDEALARASTGESACYIEVVGGKMDFPPVLATAHQRLDAMYAND